MINDFGAIIDSRNKNNQTAEELAKSNGCIESYKILSNLLTMLSYFMICLIFKSTNLKKGEARELKNSLSSNHDWLHENTFYFEAIALLQSVGYTNGLFLIIKNERTFNNYNLLFYFKHELNNYEIFYVSFFGFGKNFEL